MSRAATEYRYEKLTWPEINDAIEMGKVCVIPCGSVEQHGHHLPLDIGQGIVCTTWILAGHALKRGSALAQRRWGEWHALRPYRAAVGGALLVGAALAITASQTVSPNKRFDSPA